MAARRRSISPPGAAWRERLAESWVPSQGSRAVPFPISSALAGLTVVRHGAPCGAIEGLDRGQVTSKAFDLDCRKLPRATLSQRRGPNVAGEHIRVAVHAERHLLLW